MAHSLSLDEIREAFRLVFEVREVGSDVYAWNQVLVEELHRKLGSVFTASFIFPLPLDRIRMNDAVLFCEQWEFPQYRSRWEELYARGDLPTLPTVVQFFSAFESGRTVRRIDLIDDSTWHASQEFLEFRSSCAQDDIIMSAYVVPSANQLHGLSINLPNDGRRFSESQRDFVQLVHNELIAWMGERLSLRSNVPYRILPPRLKQVFERLMAGLSEPQIGEELSISKHTVHDYVSQIYRRFQVRSRSELMAAAYDMGWGKRTGSDVLLQCCISE